MKTYFLKQIWLMIGFVLLIAGDSYANQADRIREHADRLSGLDLKMRQYMPGLQPTGPLQGDKDFSDQLISESVSPAHFTQDNAVIINLSGGGWLSAWSDDRQGSKAIFWQQFDPLGVTVGDNVLIAGSNNGSDYVDPHLLVDTLGQVYLFYRNQTTGLIFGRRYNASLNIDLTEFLINDTSGGSFAGPFDAAVFPDGQTVVTWENYLGSVSSIAYRLYSSSGVSLVGPDSVNSDLFGTQHLVPAVAIAPGSGFIITWEDYRNGNADIYARQFTGAGVAVAIEFAVVPPPDDAFPQYSPDIIYSIKDKYVIGWLDQRLGQEIYLQRFDQTIGVIGSNQLVSSGDTLIVNSGINLSVNGSGQINSTWAEFGQTNRILKQRFDSGLVVIGSPTVMNQDSLGQRWGADIDFDNLSNSGIVWTEIASENADIKLMLFDSLDNRLFGAELKVNDDTSGAVSTSPVVVQSSPWYDLVCFVDKRNDAGDIYVRAVNIVGNLATEYLLSQDTAANLQSQPSASSSLDRSLVVWNDSRSIEGLSGQRIYGRFCSHLGTPEGNEFMISDSAVTEVKTSPKVVTASDGRTLVAWIDHRDGSGQIYGQWLGTDGLLDGLEFIVSEPVADSAASELYLGIDSSDNFYLTWLDRGLNEPAIKGRWYSRDLASGGTFNWVSTIPSVAIDEMAADIGSDSVITLFWTGTLTGVRHGYLVQLHPDGSIATPATDIVDNGAEPTDPEIAVSENGYIVCAWIDRRTGRRLIYNQIFNPSMVALGINEVVSSASPDFMISPAVDAGRGRAWFVWSDPRANGMNIYGAMKTYNPSAVVSTSVDNLPLNFTLEQNYPNPFNPATTIAFVLSQRSKVKLEVFDVLGRRIRTLLDSYYPAGRKTIVWDGTNDYGQSLASGIYFYRLTSNSQAQTRKMIFLK